METSITLITILLYSACFLILLKGILQKTGITHGLTICMFVCLVSHLGFLAIALFPSSSLALGFFQVSSLIFFVIGCISLASLFRRLPVEILILPVFPASVLTVALTHWFPTPSPIIIAEPTLISHIVLSILAYSLITLSALQAFLVSVQEALFRKHDFKGVFEFLPPLQTMEKLLFELIWMGFILLTLSILSGFLFLEDLLGQHVAHKTVLSIVAWMIFATLLVGRHRYGWRGPIASQFTIAGFLFLMLAYYGSKFVLEILLQRTV